MSTHPLLGGSAGSNAENWAVMEAWLWRRGECRWVCNLCHTHGIDRDPVAAIRAHLAEAHGTATPTRVSTDVRDSIWRGVR